MYVFLIAIFTASLTIAAVLASKIIQIGIFSVPAGILAYSITFACTDIIGEVYGKQAARSVVLAGFASLILVILLIKLAIIIPPAPFWPNQTMFVTLLGSSERIIIASLAAYLLSQLADVWLFARLRQLTDGRYLWLRNNGSTIVSQLLDSIVFIVIAFAGVFPLLPMILGQWLIKLVIALADTPLVYAGVHLLRRKHKHYAAI